MGDHLSKHIKEPFNDMKVTILLEELLNAGYKEAEYDAWLNWKRRAILKWFCGNKSNSKIPALIDYSNSIPQRIFESGAILMYLAQNLMFLPKSASEYTEMLSWLFWQMGSAPYLGGGFGHFRICTRKICTDK